ncbi:SHOCT domain-containing protein [Natrialba sp. INN-245]|uniref:SHOCT domain-containing protein n=1 Tax=Natrialba sp. INN-245 TaxID=2690967 RepID=UPI001313ABDA|nr:SHOCT domain-containing protein [Natrialba sp. INN-245]MWV40510.1 SHOCT domain-containing protein [Natrialba sp. INN-245]
MGRLSTFLLKGLGLFLLGVIALFVAWTIISTVVSLVVSVLVTAAVLGAIALAAYGLYTLLSGDDDQHSVDSTPIGRSLEDRDREAAPPDPETRVRSRYVDGEIDEAELERELDYLLEEDDGIDRQRSRSDSREFDRR